MSNLTANMLKDLSANFYEEGRNSNPETAVREEIVNSFGKYCENGFGQVEAMRELVGEYPEVNVPYILKPVVLG
ncbi:hypothetical protein ACFL16_00365 [Patescibacteria group bacterium]